MTFKLRIACALAVITLPTFAFAIPFEVLVAQTTVGSAEPADWKGVLAYQFSDTGAVGVASTGILAAEVADPSSLVYNDALGELFVSNRHGNANPSSISRFLHVPFSNTFTPDGSITGNGLFGVHQAAFNPVTGELFAANVAGDISRFTFTGPVATPNGTIPAASARGVAVSPDGKRLYVTFGSSTIRQFDLTTNTELPSLVVPGASVLHFMRFRGNDELFIADFGGNVFDFTVDGLDDLSLAGSFASPNAIGVAFSPDLQEMFVSGHGSGIINQYLLNSVTHNWDPAGSINTGTSLGDILVLPTGIVPEPASLLTLSATSAALLLRRRR